MLATSSYYR